MLIALPLVAPAAGRATATAATTVVVAVVAAGAAGAGRAASAAIASAAIAASAARTAKVKWGRPHMDSFYARRRAMAWRRAMMWQREGAAVLLSRYLRRRRPRFFDGPVRGARVL